jgi:small subunit ribosomal protein S6
MFLVDPLQAATNYNKVREHLHEMLAKHSMKIIKESKWGDRTLAYPIRQQRKGTYVLVYMEGPAESVRKIENDCTLSEVVMRTLILSRSKEEIEKLLTRSKAEAATAKPAAKVTEPPAETVTQPQA